LPPRTAEVAHPYKKEYEAYTHKARHFLPVGGNEHDNGCTKKQPAKGGQNGTETEDRCTLLKVGIQFDPVTASIRPSRCHRSIRRSTEIENDKLAPDQSVSSGKRLGTYRKLRRRQIAGSNRFAAILCPASLIDLE
jgi:hypothetical protein